MLPELKGKLDGFAMRVPTPNVSVVDLVAIVDKKTSAEEVNAALKDASTGALKGLLQFSEEELVSIDFKGNPHSSIVDARLHEGHGRRFREGPLVVRQRMGLFESVCRPAAPAGEKGNLSGSEIALRYLRSSDASQMPKLPSKTST